MRIAIVGSGALGLYYGAMLQRGGNDVHFLLRSDYEAIRAHGLQVYSTGGDFHLPRVQCARTTEEIGPVELVLVGLKTFANHRFRELIAPLVDERTIILTLQNGLGNEESLAEIFGPDRVMVGVAFLCSNRGDAGTVHHFGAGQVLLGEYRLPGMARAERLARLFADAGVECRAVDDLKKARWEKLVWNIPFNGICALVQRPVDAVLAAPASRRLAFEIMREVIAGGNAQGLTRPIPLTYAEQMVTFSEGMGPYKPSMMIDRELGRPLELEAIFARPMAQAAEHGVSMVRVEELLALLALGEQGAEF